MRSQFVVIDGVGRKDSPQVGLAEDDDVIEALPADRTDQSFRMPVPPGRPWGDRVIAYTYGYKTFPDGVAIAPVAIPDHVVRCLIPREGICELTGDPFRRWMVGNAQRDQPLCCRMTSTKSNRKPTVGTIRKSIAPMPDACLC